MYEITTLSVCLSVCILTSFQHLNHSSSLKNTLHGGYVSEYRTNFVALNFICLFTPCNRVLLEKLTGSQLVKKFPAFYGTRKIITSYALNIFQTLMYPSSGACDCVDELPHRSSCSQFVVLWSFCCGWYLVVFVLQAEACKTSTN